MKQEELEQEVKKIFERQGFDVEKSEKGLKAFKEEDSKLLQVYSSEKHSEDEILEREHKGIVFVDEGLSDLKQHMDVSIIYNEEEGEDYDLPSYELIGDIAVINELTVEEDEAVDGILDNHPHVKTILLKQGGLKGEYRVGDYRKLYGEETETVQTEFGCDFKVDPTKAYYSERFSTERNRVASQIEEGEKVLVMFAGVGPFAVMAAENASPEKVVAVEKNPEACKYLKENIKLNNVEETVEAVCGDVKNVDHTEKFDRVIMPLPESADRFLSTALENIKDNGIIHYYRFTENTEKIRQEVKQEVRRKQGLKHRVEQETKTGERGPHSKRICLDIQVFREK
ncbi:MAG: class I SAM-dependent methyltransferase family protein [Candidatus Nanohalobium sp.]